MKVSFKALAAGRTNTYDLYTTSDIMLSKGDIVKDSSVQMPMNINFLSAKQSERQEEYSQPQYIVVIWVKRDL